MDEQQSAARRTVAIVSGKGGSGKTMLIATFARILDDHGIAATLVDTDVGTGGLSYYLSVNYTRGIGAGISEMLLSSSTMNEDFVSDRSRISKLSSFSTTEFVSIGDHRKLLRLHREDEFPKLIGRALKSIRERKDGLILLDCRGGVDEDSLAVCRAADDIILVAETDPASFQTTQYLVDVLSDRDLSHKVRGFVVNRVFDDPSVVVRQGTTAFRAAYLGAIPFDLGAIRDFNIGTIPDDTTTFYLHAEGVIARLYPEIMPELPRGLWSFQDFKVANIDDPDSKSGQMLVAAFAFYVAAAALAVYFLYSPPNVGDKSLVQLVVALAGTILVIIGSITDFRRVLGRQFRLFIPRRLFEKLLGSRTKAQTEALRDRKMRPK